ncbi:Hypothetical predicted protein [Mytilus galloprovincialis]|uniref:Core-binding (CB) domain-containing protein n=1 Tax=Mytilus galloprovincialis TaxID=29158 RepID=A0A8B6H6U8_MYTGA|nr:Hypothetical predicted protein [Mytilus galloprovincialis]
MDDLHDLGTEVHKDASSATADHATGQDGKKCLREYKIPKKTRTRKYDYRESSDDDSETDPYEEHSSEEDCISGSEAEDGEIMKSKSRRSDCAKSGVSDDESDCERFDPLDKESELFMTGSIWQEKVLGDSPVPSNTILSPPSIDEFIEDLIGNRKAWRFMKLHDNSLKFIQKKVALIMGPLFKMWQEIDGANHGKETSEMSITDVLNLIERTVLLVGQVNVACLYERRINFMAKILKGMKQAKQTLSHNQSMLTESGEVLFGDNFYNVLDKKSKNRKRAREMAKEMGLETKSRRVDKTPFQTGPSGYQQSQTGGSGRGRTFNSSNEQSKWFPKSGFKPEKRKPAGLKKRRSENSREHNTVHNRISRNARTRNGIYPTLCENRTHMHRGGNNRHVEKGGYRRSENVRSRSISQPYFHQAEERRECQANSQLKGFKQKCEISTFQNGRVPNGKKSPKKGGLDGQAGLKRSVYMSTGVKIASKISALSTWSKDVPISNTSVRPGVRPKNIHKSNETHCCTNEAHRHADSNLFGRHSNPKPVKTWFSEGPKHISVDTSLSGLNNKLVKICNRTVANYRIFRDDNRLHGDESLSPGGEMQSNSSKMQTYARIPPSLYSRSSKSDRDSERDCRSSNPGVPLCQGTTNVQNKEFIENDTIPVAYNTNARMQERDEMVLGAVDVAQNIRIGGPRDETEKALHINALELKAAEFGLKSLTKDKTDIHVHLKMDNVSAVAHINRMGGTRSPILLKNKSRDMGILPTKGNNSNSRIHSGGSKRNCGLGKSSHRKFKQLDSEQGNISTDQQNNGSVEIRSVRRSPERTIGQLCQLETRSICDPNRCVSSELVEQEPICFFPVLLDSSLPSESEQRTLESSYHNSSLAVTSVLPNAIGNVNISTNTAPSNEGFIDKPTGRDPPTNRKQNLKTSGVESFRTERKAMGLSEDASKLLVSGWRKGTQSSYNSCWRHWDRWCCERDLDPFQAPVESIANFIAYLFKSGYEYSTLNLYRSAISAFHKNVSSEKK